MATSYNFTLTGLAQSTDAALNVSYDGTNFTLTKDSKTYIFTSDEQNPATYTLVEKQDGADPAQTDVTSQLITVEEANSVVTVTLKDGVLPTTDKAEVKVEAVSGDSNIYALAIEKMTAPKATVTWSESEGTATGTVTAISAGWTANDGATELTYTAASNPTTANTFTLKGYGTGLVSGTSLGSDAEFKGTNVLLIKGTTNLMSGTELKIEGDYAVTFEFDPSLNEPKATMPAGWASGGDATNGFKYNASYEADLTIDDDTKKTITAGGTAPEAFTLKGLSATTAVTVAEDSKAYTVTLPPSAFVVVDSSATGDTTYTLTKAGEYTATFADNISTVTLPTGVSASQDAAKVDASLVKDATITTTYNFTSEHYGCYYDIDSDKTTVTGHKPTTGDTFTITGLKEGIGDTVTADGTVTAGSWNTKDNELVVVGMEKDTSTQKYTVTIKAGALPEKPTANSPTVSLSAGSDKYSLDMSAVEANDITATWKEESANSGTYTFTIPGKSAGWVEDTSNPGQYKYQAATGGQQFTITGLQTGITYTIGNLPIQYTVTDGKYTFYLTDGVVIDATNEPAKFKDLTATSKITITSNGTIPKDGGTLDTATKADCALAIGTGTGKDANEQDIGTLTQGTKSDKGTWAEVTAKDNTTKGLAYSDAIATAYKWELDSTDTSNHTVKFTPQVGGKQQFAIFGTTATTETAASKITVAEKQADSSGGTTPESGGQQTGGTEQGTGGDGQQQQGGDAANGDSTSKIYTVTVDASVIEKDATKPITIAKYSTATDTYEFKFGDLTVTDATTTTATETEATFTKGTGAYVSKHTPEQYVKAATPTVQLDNATVTQYNYTPVSGKYGFKITGLPADVTAENFKEYFTFATDTTTKVGTVTLKDAALTGNTDISLTDIDKTGGTADVDTDDLTSIEFAEPTTNKAVTGLLGVYDPSTKAWKFKSDAITTAGYTFGTKDEAEDKTTLTYNQVPTTIETADFTLSGVQSDLVFDAATKSFYAKADTNKANAVITITDGTTAGTYTVTVKAGALPETPTDNIVLKDNTTNHTTYSLTLDGIDTSITYNNDSTTTIDKGTLTYKTKTSNLYFEPGTATTDGTTTYTYKEAGGGQEIKIKGFNTEATEAQVTAGVTITEGDATEGKIPVSVSITSKDLLAESTVALGETTPEGYTATLTADSSIVSESGTAITEGFAAGKDDYKDKQVYTAAGTEAFYSAGTGNDEGKKIVYNPKDGGTQFVIGGIVDLTGITVDTKTTEGTSTFKKTVDGKDVTLLTVNNGTVTLYKDALKKANVSFAKIGEANYTFALDNTEGTGIATKATPDNGYIEIKGGTATYTTKATPEYLTQITDSSAEGYVEGYTTYKYNAGTAGEEITVTGLNKSAEAVEKTAITNETKVGITFTEGEAADGKIPVSVSITSKDLLTEGNVTVNVTGEKYSFEKLTVGSDVPTEGESADGWGKVGDDKTVTYTTGTSAFYTVKENVLEYTAAATVSALALGGVDSTKFTEEVSKALKPDDNGVFEFKTDIGVDAGVTVTSNKGYTAKGETSLTPYAFNITKEMTFFASDAAENISVSAGNVNAGAGDDTISVTGGTVSGGAGDDSLSLSGSGATIVTSDGKDTVNNAEGLVVSVSASEDKLVTNLVEKKAEDSDTTKYDVQIMDGGKLLTITDVTTLKSTDDDLTKTATIKVLFADEKDAKDVSVVASEIDKMVTWGNNNTAVTLNASTLASGNDKKPYTFPQFTSTQYGEKAPKLVSISAAGVTTDLYIEGNDKNNYIVAGTGANTIDGGAGTDTVRGGTGADTFVLSAGNLVVQNFGENDVIQVTGGASAVTTSLKGNDVIFTVAEVGNVTVVGGANGSTPESGNKITLVDEKGADISSYRYNKFGVVNDGSISLLSADKSFKATDAITNIEATNSSVVTITAGGTATTILGNDKNNVINGGAGNDSINGVGGKNTLNGGTGDDTLVGGTGVDLFADSVGANVIEGYEAADKIQLNLDTFTNITFSEGTAKDAEGKETKTSDVTFADENGNSVKVINGANGDTVTFLSNGKTVAKKFSTLGSFNKDETAVTLATGVTGGFDPNTIKSGSDLTYPKLATIDSSAVTSGGEIKAIADKASHLTNEGNTVGMTLTGSSANDVLTAGEAGDTLVGNGGKDTMIASSVEAADTFVFTADSSNSLVIKGFGTGDKIQVNAPANADGTANTNASLTTDAEVTKQGDVIFTVYNDKKKYGTVTVDGAAKSDNVQIALEVGGSTTNNFYSKDGILSEDGTSITLNSFYGEKEYSAADGIVSVDASATSKLVTLTGAGGGNLIANVKNNVLVGAGGDSLEGGKGNDTFAVGSGDYVADYGIGSDKVSLSAFDMSQLTGVSITPDTAASGDTPASDSGVIALAFDGGEVSIHAENTAKEIDIIDENNPKGNGFRFVDGGIAEGKSVTILSEPSGTINMSDDAYKPFNELVANVTATVTGKTSAATTIDLLAGGQATGGSKADKLFAEAAATLDGAAGNDTLFAASGQLTGGAGNDLFVYDGGEVTITDYNQSGNDKVSLGAGWSITDVTAAGVLTVSDGENSGTLTLSNYTEGTKLTLVTTTETTNAKGVTKTKSSTSNIYLGDGVISNNSEITKAKSVTVLSGAGGDFGSIEGSGSSAKAAYSVSSIISGAAGTDVVGTNKANTIVLENGGTGKGGLGNDTYIIKGGDVTISDFGIGTKSALNTNSSSDTDKVIKLPTAINTVAGKKDSIVAYSDDTYAPGKDSVKINGKITNANVNVNETAGSFEVKLSVDYGDSTGTVTLENILRGYKWKKGDPIEANSLAKDFGKVTIYQAVNGDEKYKKTTLAKLGVSADDFIGDDASLSDLVSSADLGGDVTANNYGTFGGNMSGDAVLASASNTSTKK